MTAPPTSERPADEDENVLLSALRTIAQGECWGRETDADDCNCPVCEAEYALRRVEVWRFEAALNERVTNGFHPAEARMVEAWRKYMGDRPDDRLAQILKLEGAWDVTRRDWYVATSVVQWLATNIGSTVVEAAGYKYTKYEEDRACREAKLPPTLSETAGERRQLVREQADLTLRLIGQPDGKNDNDGVTLSRADLARLCNAIIEGP